jgi:predicted membrane-bound mannosyltransferase
MRAGCIAGGMALAWAIGAGVCAGLMLATKETALLFLFAAAVAAAASGGVGRKPALGQIAVAGAVAIGVAALLYSSFGTHVAGVRDALAALGHGLRRATGESGQEKPWWYYARLFGWQRSGGVVFEQLALAGLALAGAIVALVSGQKFLRGTAGYVAVIACILSLTPYKTPWLAVQFVPGLALLAAGALAAVPHRGLAAGLGALALATQGLQTQRVVFTYPADARNPYAYVHSSPDVLKFRALAEAALARAPQQPVRVIGEEYWPLPWYLRGLPGVGYWSAPPDACDGALVIVSASQAAVVRARLHGAYRESILGLRPGFLCVVFTPRSP